MTFRFGSFSETGGKPENEDFVIARTHPANPDVLLCFLADGQGGRPNGALASRSACESAEALAMATSWERLTDPRVLISLLEKVDQAVVRTDGFTTLTVLVLVAEPGSPHLIGASCGDSKIYFQETPNPIIELTALQRKNPPIGCGMAEFVTFTRLKVDSARLILASDGVWKYAGFEAIQETLALPDLAEAPDYLKSATLRRQGHSLPDDFSLIWVETSRKSEVETESFAKGKDARQAGGRSKSGGTSSGSRSSCSGGLGKTRSTAHGLACARQLLTIKDPSNV